MVIYDRRRKTYKSDLVPGAFPTRIEAKTAELPPDLLEAALRFEPRMENAALAANIIMSRKFYYEHGETYTVQAADLHSEGANPLPDLNEAYYITTTYACTCASRVYPCKHIIAVNVFLYDAMVARRYCRSHTC